MGEKQKAIESYENYKVRVKDTLIVKNIDEYIKKLKQQQWYEKWDMMSD